MAVFLVRHAVAVGRSSWDGDDRLRPLTKRGEREAQGLVRLLADADIRRIVSSPALRCRDTVAPLGAKLGIDVADAEVLLEGTKAKARFELLYDLAARKGDSVACVHGDLVPEVIRRLDRDGMAWDGDLRFAKGSTWLLTWDDGRFTTGTYLPPIE
jgi:8-oxo-dGTP diphosphatase